MLQQYNQIVLYLNSLINTNALPKPMISELKILFSRLGVQGYCSGLNCCTDTTIISPNTKAGTRQSQPGTETGDNGVDPIITNEQLLASLSQSSEATFPVSDAAYCNVNRFCDLE